LTSSSPGSWRGSRNTTAPKPFAWTYEGNPLKVAVVK
jgi:hypothetical protein